MQTCSLPAHLDLLPLIRKLMERPYVLFTEESKGVFSFSHQAFREFVWHGAWLRR